MILMKQKEQWMRYSGKTVLGQLLIVVIIISLLTSCRTLKKEPRTQVSDGPSVWVGKKGEIPTEVWKQRDWIIADSTIYRVQLK